MRAACAHRRGVEGWVEAELQACSEHGFIVTCAPPHKCTRPLQNRSTLEQNGLEWRAGPRMRVGGMQRIILRVTKDRQRIVAVRMHEEQGG